MEHERKEVLILRAAARLLRRDGPTRLAMSAVAAETPASRVTLYGYFPDKEALLAAVLAGETGRWNARAGAAVAGAAAADIPSRARALFDFLASPPDTPDGELNAVLLRCRFELPDGPARGHVDGQRDRLRGLLSDLAARCRAADPEAFIDALQVLADGTVLAATMREPRLAGAGAGAAQRLMVGQLRSAADGRP